MGITVSDPKYVVVKYNAPCIVPVYIMNSLQDLCPINKDVHVPCSLTPGSADKIKECLYCQISGQPRLISPVESAPATACLTQFIRTHS